MIKLSESHRTQLRLRVHWGSRPNLKTDRCDLSLSVDWLPALFANAVEYPRFRACIHKDGRRMRRVGEPVSILAFIETKP